ncbi:3'(2'),5'-bisphosphate nucleotidase CysQ [Stappia stellulata]|uniref:3'(2'),5'-bisphosphate nucleotidase CysQ n=1 Tax=Stappia stellulata TaxID=71235 RepID=UPI00040DF6D8|nr:3'(2'),5'-bisphosphate nucleotidase CysQ [Stappia stellulata]
MLIGQELQALAAVCDEAGDIILSFFRNDVSVDRKPDDSPVTEADRRAEDVILSGLSRLYPDIPVVAEEAASSGAVPDISDRFFLVDPLDGTREFISGRGDFTVNIALVENGLPVVGAVFAPHRKEAFVGARGGGAFERVQGAGAESAWRPVRVREQAAARPVAVASRSHRDANTDLLLERLGVAQTVSVGSSLKFCLVARGEADFYPRFNRTMEWDTAAGHAILAAAGGTVAGLDGNPFLYGKRNQATDDDFANPGFLAAGDDRLIVRTAALICATNNPARAI